MCRDMYSAIPCGGGEGDTVGVFYETACLLDKCRFDTLNPALPSPDQTQSNIPIIPWECRSVVLKYWNRFTRDVFLKLRMNMTDRDLSGIWRHLVRCVGIAPGVYVAKRGMI
eukprot:sb/3477035/